MTMRFDLNRRRLLKGTAAATAVTWSFGGIRLTAPPAAAAPIGRYLVVGIGTGTTSDPRRPKYIADLTPGVNWTAMDFGAAPVFLVAAELDAATEATLNANADFFTVPPLDTTLTAGQVTAVQTRLEALGVPAGWVSTSHTWRQVLKSVMAMFQLAQRANVSIVQANLNLTLAQISVATRNALQNAALSLGFSLTGITGTTTVRQALKALADQWTRPLSLGGNL